MRIYEIFNSIDGECNLWGQGTFSTFIRFSGCNLNCAGCDTEYARAFDSGLEMSVEQIMKIVDDIGCKKVTITGGEPLLQRNNLGMLLQELIQSDYKISVETNGSLLIPPSIIGLEGLVWIVDYKLDNPEKMNIASFANLTEQDCVKFVIGSLYDITRSEKIRKTLVDKGCKARFYISPFNAEIGLISDAVSYIQDKKYFDLPISLQIHKLCGLK
jgi:7-carboxy-7-deazaguanine synthase